MDFFEEQEHRTETPQRQRLYCAECGCEIADGDIFYTDGRAIFHANCLIGEEVHG